MPVVVEALESRLLFALDWGPAMKLIHADQATRLYPNINGAGEVIVDIDSGIDFAHPALAGRIWTNPGEIFNNGIDDDGNGFVDDVQGWNFLDNNNDPTDLLGHGTQTAGILAADTWQYPVDQKFYRGLAQGAQIMPLKISTDPASSVQFDQRVGQALDYVIWMVQNHPEYHIVAVNLSLAAFSEQSFQQSEQAQVDQLHNLGVFVAAAAGNQSSLTTVDEPANDPNVYAISGTNLDGSLSPASNRGAKVAMVAPANMVPLLSHGQTFITGGDGTSYATPFITAAAADLKQVNPDFTPDQIMSILQRTGTETYDRASHRTYRLLNIFAAIALARDSIGTPSTPFLGMPAAVPGVIQAENFDAGGEGVAYHDTTPTNDGHRYRTSEGVDIERSFEGTYDVTNTFVGEYLRYTIDVKAGGTFNVSFRVASRRTGGIFHLEDDGIDVTGPMQVPRTRGAQTYVTITKPNVPLTFGTHRLKLVFDKNSSSGSVGNFDWIQISAPTSRRAVATIAVAHSIAASATSDNSENWLSSRNDLFA